MVLSACKHTSSCWFFSSFSLQWVPSLGKEFSSEWIRSHLLSSFFVLCVFPSWCLIQGQGTRDNFFNILNKQSFLLPVVPNYVLCYEGRMRSSWEEEVILESPSQREQEEATPLPATVKHWKKKVHESRTRGWTSWQRCPTTVDQWPNFRGWSKKMACLLLKSKSSTPLIPPGQPASLSSCPGK